MVPNRERMYVVGSGDDDGLTAMLKFAQEDVQHERYISGLAFRLERDDWKVWLPPAEHVLHNQFRLLYIQTMGQMYADQVTLLNRRREQTGEGVFAATFSGIADQATGCPLSYCVWGDGIDALLPETDQVFFMRRSGDGATTAARGNWQTVRRLAGNLMEAQGIYPERWRVRRFPDESVLAQIGGTI